jgi:hypothetical protein
MVWDCVTCKTSVSECPIFHSLSDQWTYASVGAEKLRRKKRRAWGITSPAVTNYTRTAWKQVVRIRLLTAWCATQSVPKLQIRWVIDCFQFCIRPHGIMFNKWQGKLYLVIFIKDSCRLECDAASPVADISKERSFFFLKSQEWTSYLEDKSSGLIETLGDVRPRTQYHIRKDCYPQSYCHENIRTSKITHYNFSHLCSSK